MKVSMSLLKLLIRMIILMILFVMIFLISTMLYSLKFWPDIHNYIHANITIKRIPTLSELNLTVAEVYVTETYTTTDGDYVDMSTTDDFDLEEFTLEEIDVKYEKKRNILIEIPKDYIEMPSRPIFIDYVFLDDPITEATTEADGRTNEVYERLKVETNQNFKEFNEVETDASTTREGYLVGDRDGYLFINKLKPKDVTELTTNFNENDEYMRAIKDSVDVSRLTTRSADDVEMISKKPEKFTLESTNPICQGNSTCQEFAESIYPSIATIFVKNDSNNNQFNYYCDGVLLSDRVILTDARCMMVSNKTLEPEDVLVFLGKASLHTIGGDEKILRVKQIMVHENFTSDGGVKNDLALVVLDEPAQLTPAVHEACLSDRNEGLVEHAATTAWSVNGDLVPIIFNKEKSSTCNDKDSDVFCATYANHVAFCPSYGGVYAAKNGGKWCVEGVFYGDPEDRGICFTKDVLYTSLNNYTAWIDDVVMINKNDV